MQNTLNKEINPAQSNSRVTLDTAEMFGESLELEIKHRGDIYRLRITKQGKLLLTK